MVDWSTCPVRIAPFQHCFIFANISALSPTIPFRLYEFPPF